MPIINWPTAYAVDKAIRISKVDTSEYIGLSMLAPYKESQFQMIKYKEYHNAGGMTNPHTLGNEVKLADRGKVVEKSFKPLYWKEAHRFKEDDILELKSFETEYQRMTVDEMVKNSLAELRPRVVKRIEWMIFEAILNGKITIADENNVSLTANYGVPSGNITLTPSVKWSTADTAKPIDDIQGVAISNFKGTGYKMGIVVMNSKTMQYLCNAKDTYTKYKGSSIREAFTVGTAVKLLEMLFPNIKFVIYDGCYDLTNGTVINYLPDGKIVFWPLAPQGEVIDFVSTPAIIGKLQKPKPGIFAFTVDKTGEANPYFDIVSGIYGAPRIRRPESYFVMYVL